MKQIDASAIKKYDDKLVLDYIKGNIQNRDYSELESDKDFMMKVFIKSNDSKYYYLCSDKLLKDYDFIKFIIMMFKHDLNFICNVSKEYLNISQNELEKIELNIIMESLTKLDKDKNMKFKTYNELRAALTRIEIEFAKENKSEDVDDLVGMGFLIVYNECPNSHYILNYYAKNFVNTILHKYGNELEKTIHKEYKSALQLKQRGINSFMIKFISKYDSMLSSYLCTNIDLLDEVKEYIDKIETNWNNYYDVKINDLFINLFSYMQQVENKCILETREMIYYVAKKLNIEEELLKIDGIDKQKYSLINSNIEESNIQRIFMLSPQDKFTYLRLMDIAENTISKEEITKSKKRVLEKNI